MESHTHEWLEKLSGVIFGGALGDAAALPAEGSDPNTLADMYPNGINYPYKGAYHGWPTNDWTDATDTTVVVMRAIAAWHAKKQPVLQELAAQLSHWVKNGFQELGDVGAVKPEGVTLRAVQNTCFLREPLAAATEVKGFKTENGALIRVAPCGFFADPTSWAMHACTVTHCDAMCVAASVTLAQLLRSLIDIPPDAPVLATLAVAPVAMGRECIWDPARRAEFTNRLANTARLDQIGLEDRERPSHVLKALAVAVWALRQLARTRPADRNGEFYKKVIRAVAAKGGDATANCAIAGAVLGAAMGARRLPRDWVEALPNREWLEKEVAKFAEAMADTQGY